MTMGQTFGDEVMLDIATRQTSAIVKSDKATIYIISKEVYYYMRIISYLFTEYIRDYLHY